MNGDVLNSQVRFNWLGEWVILACLFLLFGVLLFPRLGSYQDAKGQLTYLLQSIGVIDTPAERSSGLGHFTQLQIVRSQIELYQVQHGDKYPTLIQLQDKWSVFMNQTNKEGAPGGHRAQNLVRICRCSQAVP